MTSFFNRRQTEADSEAESRAVSLPPRPGFDTVLGAGCMMEGKLGSSGNVRLDGRFNGALDITGNILVGETAEIIADIHARNISIAGAVKGNVSGNKVQILRTGRVWGDITAAALTTEEGAFIDGKITMLRVDSNKQTDAAPKPPEPIDWTKHEAEQAEPQNEPVAAGAKAAEAAPEASVEVVEASATTEETAVQDVPADDAEKPDIA